MIYIMVLILSLNVAFAFSGSSSSYNIGSTHMGNTGSVGSSTSFSIRSTTTFEQGGNRDASSTTYDINVGHFSISNVTFIPIPTEGVWDIYSGTGMIYESGDTFKSVIQLKDSDNIFISDKYCYNLVRYPNNTIFLNWTLMTEINESSGIYYYDSNVTPQTEGIYIVEYKCEEVASSEIKAYSFENFYVSSWVNNMGDESDILNQINSTVGDINTTVNEIESTTNQINITTTQINNTVNDIDTLVGEINETTHQTYDLLVSINSTLDLINDAIDNIEVNFSSSELTTINNNLNDLREEVDVNNEFINEIIFLITDSIISSDKTLETHSKEEVITNLEKIKDNLDAVKDLSDSKIDYESTRELIDNESKPSIFIYIGMVGIVIILLISIFRFRSKNKSEVEVEKWEKQTN